jgi:hypothetical protein
MLVGTTANAATTAKQSQQTVITVPMTLVNGAPPAGVSPYAPVLGGTQQASPLNQVNGNCGYSYFYINNAGGGNGHIFYGFHTNRTGYDYFSETYVYGNVKYNSVTHSGWLGFLGTGSQDYCNDYEAYLGIGAASGTVEMWSYLGNNQYCYSGWPSSATYIT